MKSERIIFIIDYRILTIVHIKTNTAIIHY